MMVATDLAARGLDFPGTIDHVINFDMPGNAIDYLHRWVGRDGWMHHNTPACMPVMLCPVACECVTLHCT